MLREDLSSWEMLRILELMKVYDFETYADGGVLSFLVDIEKNKEIIEQIIPSENMKEYKKYYKDLCGSHPKDEEKGLIDMYGVISIIEDREREEILYLDEEFSYRW